mmetsp:Transcript_46739/g.117782  ORF Transcript_46739/g.117782 Transcript_46739/m.117782 type:complete len:570 (+) Transcript_46739:152-1861(+)
MDPQILPEYERQYYDMLFAHCDQDKDNLVNSTEAQFFKNSGLPLKTLGKIWTLVDTNKNGYILRDQFYLVMKYIALAQNNYEPTPENVASVKDVPLANFGSAFPQPVIPLSSSFGPGVQPGRDWVLTPKEVLKYRQIFNKNDDDHDGHLTGDQAKVLFMRSGLPTQDLLLIWDLAKVNKPTEKLLDFTEFIIAMHLINTKLSNKDMVLPPDLPPSLRTSALSLTGSLGKTAGEDLIIQDVDTISPEGRAKFREHFLKYDANRDGFISGEEAKLIFSRSGLPVADLRKIWDLADENKDGKLDMEEFIVGMHLIHARLKKLEIPDVLPPGLQAGLANRPKPAATPMLPSPPKGDMTRRKSLEEVNRRIKRSEDESAQVQRRAAEAEAARRAAAEEIKAAEAKARGLEEQVKRASEEAAHAEEALAAERARVEALQGEAAEAQATLAGLKERKREADGRLQELQEQRRGLDKQVAGLRAQAAKAKEEADDAAKGLALLQDECAALEASAKRVQEELAGMQAKKQQAQQAVRELTEKRSTLKADWATLSSASTLFSVGALLGDLSTAPSPAKF